METECTEDTQETSWTTSESFFYFQFTLYV